MRKFKLQIDMYVLHVPSEQDHIKKLFLRLQLLKQMDLYKLWLSTGETSIFFFIDE